MGARLVVLAALVVAAVAHAHDDTPDANIFPDASVDPGGADLGSEETEDSSLSCSFSNDCERGWDCIANKCRYRRVRDATFVGCGASPVAGVGLVSVAVAVGRLRPRRRRR